MKDDDLDLLDDDNDDFDNGNDDFLDDGLDSSIMDDGYGQAPIDKHNDLLKDLSNFDTSLEKVFKKWLGLKWDEKTEQYIRDVTKEPIMNLKCAEWCLIFLLTYARANNILTDIAKEQFKNMSDDMIDVVWLNISTKMEEFGIKDDGDVLLVCNQLLHWAELVLAGAGDGKYFERLGKVTTRSEHVNAYNPGHMQQPMMMQTPQQRLNKVQKAFRWLTGK